MCMTSNNANFKWKLIIPSSMWHDWSSKSTVFITKLLESFVNSSR